MNDSGERDGRLMIQGYWEINKYDEQNRLIKNGLWLNADTRVNHQGFSDANINYPTAAFDVMQENY